MVKKLWEWSGWIFGAYSVYSHLQTLDKLRGQLYDSLMPDQKAKVDSIIGAVKQELPTAIFNQPLVVAVPAPAPTAAQVIAGT